MLAVGLVLTGLTTGCGSQGARNTIKLGGNLEMTGESASYGISSRNGIELALKEQNEKGGVLDKKVELVVADNKSEATGSHQCYAETDSPGPRHWGHWA